MHFWRLRSKVTARGVSLLTLVLGANSVAAQPANAPANGVAPTATTPQNQPNPSLVVVFEPSAAALPQDDIRAAIARELGVSLAAPGDFALPVLSIGVEADHLLVRYRSGDAINERLLPLPGEPSQIPIVLSLIAGNLARDQRKALAPEPTKSLTRPPAAASPAPRLPVPAEPLPPPAPPATRAPKPTLAFNRHWFGVHVAQDIMQLGRDHVCTQNADLPSDYSCFYEGTERRYFGTTYPPMDKAPTRLTLATTRVLLSYDYAFSDRFSLGGRAGYAFGGGPPAHQAETTDPSLRGGTPFLPWHLEARASYWLVPLSSEPWHVFVGGGAGMLQVDAPVTIREFDCNTIADADRNGSVDEALYNSCLTGSPTFPGGISTMVTAWKKAGVAMLGAHAGASLTLFGDVEAMFNLNVMMMMPATALVLEPSLGIAGL
jgi:hypothetical protein